MKLLRLIKYLVLMVLAAGIVVLSLANRGPMTLQLLPEDLAAFAGYNQSIELPVFVVILMGVAVGLLIGFIWEWLREYRLRADAARARAEARRLRETMAREGRPEARREGDDVLALLEGGKGQSQAAR
ncbi:MAG: lipopolysaccharide assembly protein LapA domain-containing protein [Alkalilacustris sp.]